jgi:outer membrane biosynthesis protein TonB
VKRCFAAIMLPVISCATAASSSNPSSTSVVYVTQAECHPEIPQLDPRDPRVMPPKVLSKVEPAFPEEVRAAREPIDALVIVEAIIDERGSVTDVCALKGDPRLVQATIAALRQWKFTPGMIDGRPSAFRFASTTNYKLH